MAKNFLWSVALAFVTIVSFSACSRDNVKDKDQYDESAPAVRDDDDVIEIEVRDYRTRTEVVLDENDAKIAEYREKIRESDDPVYKAKYEGRIDALEEENAELRARLRGYNREKDGNWDNFKGEFEHDMEELGDAIRGLFKDEVKNEND